MNTMRRSLIAIPLFLMVQAASSCLSGSGSVTGESREAQVCEVHHLPLETRKVSISYGLPPAPGKDHPTRQQTVGLFPHRTRNVEGGCMVGPERTATLKVCKGCDAAHAEWLAKLR